MITLLLYCERIFTHVIKGPEGRGITDEKQYKGVPNLILRIYRSIRHRRRIIFRLSFVMGIWNLQIYYLIVNRYIKTFLVLFLSWPQQEIWLIDLELAGPNYRGFDLMKLFRAKPELFSVSNSSHDVVYGVKSFIRRNHSNISCLAMPKMVSHLWGLHIISYAVFSFLEPRTTVDELILECRTCEALTWLEVCSLSTAPYRGWHAPGGNFFCTDVECTNW